MNESSFQCQEPFKLQQRFRSFYVAALGQTYTYGEGMMWRAEIAWVGSTDLRKGEGLRDLCRDQHFNGELEELAKKLRAGRLADLHIALSYAQIKNNLLKSILRHFKIYLNSKKKM